MAGARGCDGMATIPMAPEEESSVHDAGSVPVTCPRSWKWVCLSLIYG